MPNSSEFWERDYRAPGQRHGPPETWRTPKRGLIAKALVIAGFLMPAIGLGAFLWPSPAQAATVYCTTSNPTTATGPTGVVARSYIDVYADPICSGGTRWLAYDHYDITIPATSMNFFYLDFLRIWRCGSLIYTQSDGGGGGTGGTYRNVWPGWKDGSSCGFQSDHQTHYYRLGILDVWLYNNI